MWSTASCATRSGTLFARMRATTSWGFPPSIPQVVIVLDDGPPPERKRGSRAPIPAAKAYPLIRNSERRDNVSFRPAVKESPLNCGPIAEQPGFDELGRPDQVQAIYIARITGEENLIVGDAGRNHRHDMGSFAR